MRARTSRILRICATAVLMLCGANNALAQLNEHCTVSVLNRTVRVNPDGSWLLPNVPAATGQVKARATCVENGLTRSGESDFFIITPNRMNAIPPIRFGTTSQVPSSLAVTPGDSPLTSAGSTLQLTVVATYPTGPAKPVTLAGAGTNYTTSNPAFATVSTDGLVTAVASGTVVIQATNDGTPGIVTVRVLLSTGDSDGDGIPDEYELAHGLDPNNPIDAQEDPDRDGLTNLQEFQAGTDPHLADTDNDGLTDGREVALGTNPLLWDTDGDGVSDGLEVEKGTDPLDRTDFNLSAVVSAIRVTPASFVLSFNTIAGDASIQLTVTGTMLDGRTIDLTTRGANYATSDPTICNFGGTDGQVFAGASGPCTITVTVAGFTGTSTGTVRAFSPVSLGSLQIPGYANNVDVNGNFAYVAAGVNGLVIVGVSNPSAPEIVGTLDTPGNANDVRVVGNLAYVADGPAGLQIIDVTDPTAPRLRGSLHTSGEANDVIISGTLAFVAGGPSGLQIINVSDPAAPTLVRTVATPGTARGVDVSASGSIVVVVEDDQPGLQVIDVADPANASIVGAVSLVDPDPSVDKRPTDVSLGGGYAYVAAYTGGMSIVDVRQPTAPVVIGGLPGSFPGGFVPRDVQIAGKYAIFAEQLFANAVAPIVDVSTPSTPQFRAVLDFGQDYAGTGIAVSGPFVYWTGQSFVVGSENGTTGNTRLFIGQYLVQEDLGGVSPTVTLTAPAGGSTFLEGESLTVRATATDDVAVAQVAFTVTGLDTFVDTSEPFQFTFTIPQGTTSLVLGATATDLGGNTGVATSVQVNVAPDPLTTVIGRVLDEAGLPLTGVNVSVLAHTGVTGSDGTFTITGVPTVKPFLVVSATLTRGSTVLTGYSAATAPVRGGETNVGDIIARAATFETDLGTQRCPYCDVTEVLPFAFSIAGAAVPQIHINSSGYFWTDGGDTVEPFCCNMTPDLGDPMSGLYTNELPGRVVVTWFNMLTAGGGGGGEALAAAQSLPSTPPGRSTVQLVLFADGRIQFGYRGIAPDSSSQVGLFPAQASINTEVDFDASPPPSVGAGEGVYENFYPGGHPFDLDGGFVVFTPNGASGYGIRPVPDTVGPVCSVTSPLDGATLFNGEPILVQATATDNGAVHHVTFRSTVGGLNLDDRSWPFSAPFVVPVGVTQVRFDVTAFDGAGNAGVCTSTVNVVAAPPPVVTITSPRAIDVLTEGSTIEVTVDASTNRVPVSRVDLIVDGVMLASATTAPQKFLFTVPAGVNELAFKASAVNTVGNTTTTDPVSVSVIPDALTTVQGVVVDGSHAPVSGAAVTVDRLHGVLMEIFNVTPPINEWPPSLPVRTPDRITVASALNLRNPDSRFGTDPFRFGGSGGHVTRLTTNLQTIGANTYTFTLGVNERGLLKVNGATVVDIPTSTGQFQQATATVPVGVGSIAIEILLVDSGNPEVQLSYALAGGDLQVVPPAALVPAMVPYTATSESSGAFSIGNVPTVLGAIGAFARFSAPDGTLMVGAAVPRPPVSGGITDVGDIVVSSAAFEPDYGTLVAQCDDCSVPSALPFAFQYQGNVYQQVFVNNNGNVTFNAADYTYTESPGWFLGGPPRIAAFWDDLIATTQVAGLYINDRLPGRFVVTWLLQAEYCCVGANTIQLVLFSDGRIQFGYHGVTAPDAIVGLSPGGMNQGVTPVDFSTRPALATGAGQAVFEQFFYNFNTFDLDGRFIVFNPNAAGGYDITLVAGTQP